MLYALKDLISSASANGKDLSAYADQMLPCLFGFADRDEDDKRRHEEEELAAL